MHFKKWTAAQYRAADAEQLAERRAAIKKELTDPESEVPTDDLAAEVELLEDAEKRSSIAAGVEARNARAAAVASGAGTPVTGAQALVVKSARSGGETRVVRDEDPYDTEDYHRAFAEFLTRGVQYPDGLVQPGTAPANVRVDAFSQTTDVQHFIPTTLSNTIIEKMASYGDLWPKLTKLNVRGGLDINYWDYLPTSSWVTEAKPSDDQKVTDATPISFKYYMLECKVAQSFLASIVTLDQFEREVPGKIAESMVRALETGYLNGTGTGQMQGVLTDTRVPAANKRVLAAADAGTYAGWVKALTRAKSYRQGELIMAQSTWDIYIDGMVDKNGQPVARVNYGVGGAHDESYRFMGIPVTIVEDDVLPGYDAASGQATDTPFAVFTKPSDYLVNQQLGMRAVRWTDEDNNLVKNKVQTVVDGKLGDPHGTIILSAPKKG
jgi:HK97 family phage major capsid protein|nr:MAG TPA: major capsid protein [Caudoviricetes sp.]